MGSHAISTRQRLQLEKAAFHVETSFGIGITADESDGADEECWDGPLSPHDAGCSQPVSNKFQRLEEPESPEIKDKICDAEVVQEAAPETTIAGRLADVFFRMLQV